MEEKKNFEKELKGLEEAVEKLEKGELPLEEAIKCFENGLESANSCRRLLESVNTRVELLLQDGQNRLKTEPFPDPGTAVEKGREE